MSEFIEIDGSVGERGGQIEYIAEVRGHELTTRGELLKDEAEHPRAKEEYYKIIKQLKSNKILKTALSDPEAKASLLDALASMMEELRKNK